MNKTNLVLFIAFFANSGFSQTTAQPNTPYKNYFEYIREITVKVSPTEASDAQVSIIRTSKIYLDAESKATHDISPDSLGTWRAPITTNLATGDYIINVRKEGFRDISEQIEIGAKEKYDLEIPMLSNKYLQQIQQPWQISKWICAGVFLGSSIVSYYYNTKVIEYKRDYYNAISPDLIQMARMNINKYNLKLRYSTGVGFSALGGFAFSWRMEMSY